MNDLGWSRPIHYGFDFNIIHANLSTIDLMSQEKDPLLGKHVEVIILQDLKYDANVLDMLFESL